MTSVFPDDERYGLTSQIRRAAVGLPANIAEGHGRAYTGDYIRFLGIATGSLMELETLIIIAHRLGMLSRTDAASILDQTEELARMLAGLRRKLRARSSKKHVGS